MYFQRIVLLLFFVLSSSAMALPIDWHGAFGVDSTILDNYRRITGTTQSVPLDAGSQEVPLAPGNHANASFQSYVFRLNPVMVVNDSATFKAEITSGYGRGGFLGDNQSTSQEAGFGNALYGQSLGGGTSNSNINLNKFFMELYSDTATYVIGRQSAHWALGAVLNSGDNTWDRHTFVRDGITINVKLGNFQVSPFWAKISSGNSLTRADNVKEYGISLLYDNAEKDLAFGIHFAKKRNNSFNSTIVSSATTTDLNGDGSANDPLGSTDTDLVDIYIRKAFGDLDFAVEVPLYSGEIGFLTNTISQSKYKAKAFIFEGNYKFNDTWKLGTNVGMVSGDDGGLSSFDAMYLNPNYQIAILLFRYNTRAVSGTTGANVHDSYITNAFYYKIGIEWKPLEKWTFDAAFISATAQETAKGLGVTGFNHTTNTFFNSAATQADDLGMEIDLGFDYQWNNEVNIGADFGLLLAGDYWAFTNNAAVNNTADDSLLLQIRTSISF